MELLAACPGFSWLYPPGIVLWPDLAGSPEAPRLPSRSAYLPAYLPGLGICTLYSRQCLACSDPYSLGGKVRRLAPYCLCWHDCRVDYQTGGWCPCLRGQPAVLGQCRG